MAGESQGETEQQGEATPSATASPEEDDGRAAQVPPQHDLDELERLRSRLIRKFHGRR